MSTVVFVAFAFAIICGLLLLDNDVDRLLASAPKPDPGWRDMDSAPLDRVILLMDWQGTVQTGQWCDEHARWYACPCCDDWINPIKWREIPH